MKASGWGLIVGAVALDTAGAAALVLADGMDRPWWLVVAYGFWAATIAILALAMTTLDTSRAYPAFLGSSTVAVAALGAAFFGDELGWRGWTGVVLIALGVVIARITTTDKEQAS